MKCAKQSSKTRSSTISKIFPWMVWGLGCIFYFYENLLQVSPSVMSNELMDAFGVTGHALGILAGVYFYSYAAMQLPCGVMMDYFGPRRLLTLATAICAVSSIAFGLTESFLMASVARLMIGFGSAFAAVGAMKLAANWFEADKFAFLTGVMVTIGMIGAVGGEAPLASLIDSYGWRYSMVIMGLLGLVITLLIFFIVKDKPTCQDQNLHTNLQPEGDELSMMQGLIALVSNRQLWLVAIYGGLMFLATPVFCGLWGVPFIQLKMGVSKIIAANFISMIFIGWAIASPLWGIYSSKIGRRKPPMYIGAIGAFIACLFFLYVDIHSKFFMQLALFLFGIFSAGFLPAFAVAKEICSKRYVATGLSFMNMMNMLGIALVQPAIGYILDYMWQGTMHHKIRIYSVHDYQTALTLLPCGILIALCIMPFIQETYCKSVSED